MKEEMNLNDLWGGCIWSGSKPQTNYDLLISKTPEELAKIIVDDWCEIVCGSPCGCDGKCEEKTLLWLKSPVEEVERC